MISSAGSDVAHNVEEGLSPAGPEAQVSDLEHTGRRNEMSTGPRVTYDLLGQPRVGNETARDRLPLPLAAPRHRTPGLPVTNQRRYLQAPAAALLLPPTWASHPAVRNPLTLTTP